MFNTLNISFPFHNLGCTSYLCKHYRHQKDLLENLPPDQRSSVLEKMKTLEETQADIDEVFEKENSLIERTEFDSEEECTNVFDMIFLDFLQVLLCQ